MIERLINLAITGWAYDSYRFFMKNMPKARSIQSKRLKAIIEANKDSRFGTRHRFPRLSTVNDFKNSVPVMDYEDYLPWIEKALDGDENILTTEKVMLFEPTGGTISGSKLIPYTESLRREFQSGIMVWLGNLFLHYANLRRGKSYWSISPGAVSRQYTKSGIPVGFEDDSDYLGWKGLLIQKTFAVPGMVSKLKNMENFRYITSYFLLKTENLALVSIWNPTFFLLLLDHIRQNLESLIKDIHDGRLSIPVSERVDFFKPLLTPSPKRARQLEKIASTEHANIFSAFWKELKLISCWQDAASALYRKKLDPFFPKTIFQGKGLLATEGMVTLPLVEAKGCIPAYTSHFLEFLAEGEEDTRLIDELDQGKTYSVIITTGGGLYRYNLQDKIEVTGFFRGLPVIAFIGRHMISDMVGEKLNEIHAQRVIHSVLERFGINPAFMIFAPEPDESGGCYILFIQLEKKCAPKVMNTLMNQVMNEAMNQVARDAAREIDSGLKENFHYKYARDLGQLKPIKWFTILRNGEQAYLGRCTSEGRKMGNIKPVLLDKRTGWAGYFEGSFCDEDECDEDKYENYADKTAYRQDGAKSLC